MPKFSVIIPVYNAEKYINQCISSLLNQEYTDYELILVNDCSTDRSLEVCEEFQKKYSNVVIINQLQNKGVSAARNRGIEAASGEYILFVDSDDFVANNYFQTLHDLTKEYNVELISFGHYDYIVDATGKTETKISGMNYAMSSNDTAPWNKLFFKTFFASPWNKLFLKKTLFHYNIRFDENCVCYEDYLFNMEYCKHITTFITTDKALYYYRQVININHVSKRKWGERFLISKKVARKTDEIIQLKIDTEDISELRRYTYKAYLVELEAAKVVDDDYNDSMKKLLKDNNFITAINSINPCGVKLTVFKIFYNIHFMVGCKYIIESLM